MAAPNQMDAKMKEFLTDFSEAMEHHGDIRWAAEEVIRGVMRDEKALAVVVKDADVLAALKAKRGNRW